MSAAAHLRTIKGLEVRVFGEPMSFWERNMPLGMLLRSAWTATEIASPGRDLTLEAYQESSGERFSKPVPVENFIRYGQWYQQHAVPDLDRRSVERVESDGKGFRLTLADGESFTSRRVIVAVGIGAFTWRPPEFANLPVALASHSSEHHDFHRFAGKSILVVGGGQSALESAALMHEAGANVEVAARTQNIHWLQGWASTTLHYGLGSIIKGLLYAPTDVGPAGLSQLCARPNLVRLLPRMLQDKLSKRAVQPAGAQWLVPRLKDVPIHLGRTVTSVAQVGERVTVKLDDRTERTVDHVLLGTGYRVDISRYKFLAPDLVASINRANGYPKLREGMETSVTGLHFLGAPAVWSLGPLMQFVSGARYAGKTLTRHVTENKL